MELLRLLGKKEGWDWRINPQGTLLLVPEKDIADRLIDLHFDGFAISAARLNGEVRISWDTTNPENPDPNKTYIFTASMSGLEPQAGGRIAEGAVFSAVGHLPAPLLKKMYQAAENERPVSITRRRDKRQIIINRPMESALRTPAVEATQRIMTNFWRPRDLEYVEQQFLNCLIFQWRYDAALREDLWATLESEFERFEVNGEWYGQTTFLVDPEPVPFPEDTAISLPIRLGCTDRL